MKIFKNIVLPLTIIFLINKELFPAETKRRRKKREIYLKYIYRLNDYLCKRGMTPKEIDENSANRKFDYDADKKNYKQINKIFNNEIQISTCAQQRLSLMQNN